MIEGSTTGPEADRCLVVLLSPRILYESKATSTDKNANVSRVAIGIIYKPSYVEAISFDKALRTIMDYRQARKGSSEADGKLVNDDLLFLHVSSQSTFLPLAKPYPTLIDYARRSMLTSGGLHLEDFRAFRLYVVNYIAPKTTEASAKVFIPRLNGVESKVIDVEAGKRPPDAMASVPTAESGSYYRSTIRVAGASELHWNITDDTLYPQFLGALQKLDDAAQMVKQEAASLDESKTSTKVEVVELGADDDNGAGGGDEDFEMTEQGKKAEASAVSQPAPAARGVSFKLGGEHSTEEATSSASRLKHMASLLKKKDEGRLASEEILTSLNNQHIMSLIELARVRMIDRTVAEGLLAESARVHLIAGEDTMRSLKTFQAQVQSSVDQLRDSLNDLLSTIPDRALHGNMMALVDQHRRETSAAAIFPLLLLDSARNDMQAFLQSRLDNISAQEESRVVADACVERFANHMNALWEFLEDPRMSNPEVAFRVQVGLSSTRPLVANYFQGALEGVLGLLGLHTPVPEQSRLRTMEGASKHHARLLKQYLAQATGGYETDWEDREGTEQEDLHLDYLKDFSVRKADQVHCVFKSNMIEDLLGPLEELKIQDHYVRKAPRAFKSKEDLWSVFRQMSHSGQDYVSDILVNSAARSTNYLFGGPDGDSQREESKGEKSEDPAGWTIQQGQPPVSQKLIEGGASRPILKSAKKGGPFDTENGKKEPLNKGPGPVKRTQEPIPPEDLPAKKAKLGFSGAEVMAHPQGATIPAGASKSMTGAFAVGTMKNIFTELKTTLGIGAPTVVASTVSKFPDKAPGNAGEEEAFEDPEDQNQPPRPGTSVSKEDRPGQEGQSQAQPSGITEEVEDDDEGIHPGPESGVASASKKTSGKKVSSSQKSSKKASAKEETEEQGEEEEGEQTEEVVKSLSKAARKEKEYSDALDETRLRAFGSDSEFAKRVRNLLLGLDPLNRLTPESLKESDQFNHIKAENVPKSAPMVDVSLYWERIFMTNNLLTTCHPDEIEIEDGWEPLYRTVDLIKLVPTCRGAWKAKESKPRFIILAHKSRSPEQLKKRGFAIENFHRLEALKRLSIGQGKDRKQVAFCPYCGIRYENSGTILSHVRCHLSFEFMCGACISAKFVTPDSLSKHQAECGALGGEEEEQEDDEDEPKRKTRSKTAR